MDSNKSYEFDDAQNESILALAKSLQFVGAACLAFSLVVAAGLLHALVRAEWPDVLAQGMLGIFTVTMGSLMIKAGAAFFSIVQTAGQDIDHLMQAIDKLRQVYSILTIVIMLAMLLTLVALALSFMTASGPAIA